MIKAKLNGGLNNFINKIINKTNIELGFFDSKNAKKAANNEFGETSSVESNSRLAQWLIKKYGHSNFSFNITPRPFMQTTFNLYRKEWANKIKNNYSKTYNAKQSLDNIGDSMVEDMQHTILHGNWASNHPLIEEYKQDVLGQHHQPLIDTEEMFDSVKYEVK